MKLNWKRAKSDLEQRSNRVDEEKPVILLVDDEELNLRLMGQLLEKYFKSTPPRVVSMQLSS